jgi:hypothetical protein
MRFKELIDRANLPPNSAAVQLKERFSNLNNFNISFLSLLEKILGIYLDYI